MSKIALKLVCVGNTGKTFGYKGELLLFIKDQYEDLIIQGDFIFIERDGNKVPYVLESVKWANECRIKLKGINSIEDAKVFTSSNVFFESFKVDNIQIEEETGDTWDTLVSFSMIDQNDENIGIIQRVEEHPHQVLAYVQLKAGKVVMVPIHDNLILELNIEQKFIQLEIADGLLEL